MYYAISEEAQAIIDGLNTALNREVIGEPDVDEDGEPCGPWVFVSTVHDARELINTGTTEIVSDFRFKRPVVTIVEEVLRELRSGS